MSIRLVVIDGGQAVQIDPPRAIFDAPENKMVATFIGTPVMNVMRADGFGSKTGWRSTSSHRL